MYHKSLFRKYILIHMKLPGLPKQIFQLESEAQPKNLQLPFLSCLASIHPQITKFNFN